MGVLVVQKELRNFLTSRYRRREQMMASKLRLQPTSDLGVSQGRGCVEVANVATM